MAIVLSGSTGIQNPLGSASAPSESNTSNSNTGAYFPTGTTYAVATAGTNALYIDASQNVGIGTTSPSTYGRFVASGGSNSGVGIFIGNASLTGSAPTYQGSIRLIDNPTSSTAASGGFEFLTSTFGSGYGWKIASIDSSGVQLTFATRQNSASWTEAMRITSSGNIGIGNQSPGYKLTVTNSALGSTTGNTNLNAGIGSQDSNTEYIEFSQIRLATGSDWTTQGSRLQMKVDTTWMGYIQFNGNNNLSGLSFGTGSSSSAPTSVTEAMRIDSSGTLMLGKTNTSAANNGLVAFPSGPVFSTIASGSNTYHVYSSTASAYRFYVSEGGTISATNTTITSLSDQRLKENITDIDIGLNAIMALKPRKFDWKAGKGKDIKGDRGFIAQEFEQVFPNLVDEWLDPAPAGEEPYKSVRQDLIPVLVKAIQELSAEVTALKAKVGA